MGYSRKPRLAQVFRPIWEAVGYSTPRLRVPAGLLYCFAAVNETVHKVRRSLDLLWPCHRECTYRPFTASLQALTGIVHVPVEISRLEVRVSGNSYWFDISFAKEVLLVKHTSL
jgi:hypothetical protein